MGALVLNDLKVMGEQVPRIQDLKVAEALGFERPRKIRELIERNRAEFEAMGSMFEVQQRHDGGRGRPTTEYWLNEEQALLAATFSNARRAPEVRGMLIKVFVAWRRGELPAQPASYPVPDAFSVMAERLSRPETMLGYRGKHEASEIAASVTYLPIWSNGRRPRWWGDSEVRAHLTAAHRQTTLAECLSTCIERFGRDRAPSLSSLHRYWQKLDEVHGVNSHKF